MAKPITIYWACTEKEWMRASEPEKVNTALFSNNNLGKLEVASCPAVRDAFKNVYAIKSIYDYSFNVGLADVTSPDYDQSFFDEHVLIRSLEKRLFSFYNRYIFFTEEPSLKITAHEHPTFAENEVSKRCMPIKGEYDIGKWFRPLEFPFILKKEFETFVVKYQDVLYYLRVQTNRPVIFKQFRLTDTLQGLMDASVQTTRYKTHRYKTMESFYGLFKGKKYLLKEIKGNLL